MKFHLLAAAAVFLFPAYAGAADLKSPPSAIDAVQGPVSAWGGLYVGVHGGYSWGNMDAMRGVDASGGMFLNSSCEYVPAQPADTAVLIDKETPKPSVVFGGSEEDCKALDGKYAPRVESEPMTGAYASSEKIGLDSWLAGIDLSYKIQRGRFIVEPFADISYYGGDEGRAGGVRDVAEVDGDIVTETSAMSVKKRLGATLGLKLGTLITKDDYLYGLGGGAWGRFRVQSAYSFEHDGDPYAGGGMDKSADAFGWTLGGGLEHRVTDNFVLGVEGRYTKLYDLKASDSASHDVCGEVCGGGITYSTTETISGDVDDWSVRVRASYRLH